MLRFVIFFRGIGRVVIAAAAAVMTIAGGAMMVETHAQAPRRDEYVRNILPFERTVDDGTVLYRIPGGAQASPGGWPTVITLHSRKAEDGGRLPYCGGTIIDGAWVLTAAHCVYRRDARDLYIREGMNVAGGGQAIDVSSITIHEQYLPLPPLNDIALLQLATAANSPRQILLTSERRSEYLREKTIFTVIGYGLAQPLPPESPPPGFIDGASSVKLLQTDVLYVAPQRCISAGGRYNPSRITEATICAGGNGSSSSACLGDSGGPLFVRDQLGQAIQAGIVSWGDCTEAGKYGVYASVGHFEDWIRSKVGNPSFLPQAATAPPQAATDQVLGPLVGGAAAAQPSRVAQVIVDVWPADRVKINQTITVRVTSSVPGVLLVFNQDTDGRSFQLFPNRFSGGGSVGQARRTISAGHPVTIPGSMDGFALRITPPVGRNRMVAVVLPAEAPVGDLLEKYMDMQPIEDLDALLEALVGRERSNRAAIVEPAIPSNRGIGVREYEITP